MPFRSFVAARIVGACPPQDAWRPRRMSGERTPDSLILRSVTKQKPPCIKNKNPTFFLINIWNQIENKMKRKRFVLNEQKLLNRGLSPFFVLIEVSFSTVIIFVSLISKTAIYFMQAEESSSL